MNKDDPADGVYELYLAVPEKATAKEIRKALSLFAQRLTESDEVNLSLMTGPVAPQAGAAKTADPAPHGTCGVNCTMKYAHLAAMICGARGPEILNRAAKMIDPGPEKPIETVDFTLQKME